MGRNEEGVIPRGKGIAGVLVAGLRVYCDKEGSMKSKPVFEIPLYVFTTDFTFLEAVGLVLIVIEETTKIPALLASARNNHVVFKYQP